jgi:hypothetical protein
MFQIEIHLWCKLTAGRNSSTSKSSLSFSVEGSVFQKRPFFNSSKVFILLNRSLKCPLLYEYIPFYFRRISPKRKDLFNASEKLIYLLSTFLQKMKFKTVTGNSFAISFPISFHNFFPCYI